MGMLQARRDPARGILDRAFQFRGPVIGRVLVERPLPGSRGQAREFRIRGLEGADRAFGVTRERIRQIENNTLKKLEGLPEAQRLRDAS